MATSYAQWFALEMPRLTDRAFLAFRDTGCAPHYLYFKPHGLEFAIVCEGANPPAGFELATGERIPTGRDRAGLTAWFTSNTARVPVLPGGA